MAVLRDMLADQLLFWFVRLTHDHDELRAAYALMLHRKQRYEREAKIAAAQNWLAKGKK